MRTVLLLSLALVAAGCARTPRYSLPPFHGECPRAEDWLAQVAVRRATHVDSALSRAERAGLAVQARAALGTTDSLLDRAFVDVFRDDAPAPATPLAASMVSRNGWVDLDIPFVAAAYVRTRRIGYVPRGELVQLRVGYRDSLIVHLRWDVRCPSS